MRPGGVVTKKRTACNYSITQFKKTNTPPAVFRFAGNRSGSQERGSHDERQGRQGRQGRRAYSSASRQISTETSSTLSGIGGSGLVALTHTPSSW